MVAKLGFRKQNLSWQLSLEVLSLSRRKEQETEYQLGCKSVPRVLQPIINTSGPQGPLLQKGLGNTPPSGFSITKKREDGEGVF